MSEPKTAILHHTAPPSEGETRAQATFTNPTAVLPSADVSARSRSKVPLITASLIILAAIGSAAWYLLPAEQEGKQLPVPPAVPNAAPLPSRVLTYSLTVQSFTDGRYKEPFALSREMLFRNRDRIRLNIKSPQSGYLYILNQGSKSESGEAAYNILFPTPTTNAGNAQLSAGQEIQIPRQSWFELDAKEGTELVWLVWSANALPELESAKRFANPDDRGRIKDTELINSIESLLRQYQVAKPSVDRDDEKKESRITGSTDIAAHLIKLEHH